MFPILFLLVYGVIVYSYVYVIQQSITYTAQQAAEAAVAVNPSPDGTHFQRVQDRVRVVVGQSLDWLPPDQKARVTSEQGDQNFAGDLIPIGDEGNQQYLVPVTIRFSVPGLFPALTLPLVGNIPPLPNQLRARAVARV